MTITYDKASSFFQNKLKITHLPLVCWDLFSLQQVEYGKFSLVQKNWKEKEDYFKEKEVVIVTNTAFKIVYASKNMYKMNGYFPNEVEGRAPNIFQGPLTSRDTLDSIKNAVQNNLPFHETILNYRKDGSVYECEIRAIPKFDSKGTLVNYIAFERLAS